MRVRLPCGTQEDAVQFLDYFGNFIAKEDDDSGNGESLSPGDSPKKASEASATLERLSAADACQVAPLPDAWLDDAQTGLSPVPEQLLSSIYDDDTIFDDAVYNDAVYDQLTYDHANYDKSAFNETPQEQPIYDNPIQKDPAEQVQLPCGPSGDGKAVFDQSTIEKVNGQTVVEPVVQETSASDQCLVVDLTGGSQGSEPEIVAVHQGAGYQFTVESSAGQSASPKGVKRKFSIHNLNGQGYKLIPDEPECMEDGKPKKIPRPPNAFMLYANEYRRILAQENPNESNKEISVRLGSMWKTMPKTVKEGYFDMARIVDAEHKKKYPHYVYNPKEARMRKALRDQTREHNRSFGNGKSPSPAKRPSSVSSQGSSKSSMSSSVQRMIHDVSGVGVGGGGGGGGGGKKGYLPMYPQAWGEMAGGQQYVVPENLMDVSAAYQNHEPNAGVYSNLMPASWYPSYYMQQDPAYGQLWGQQAAPHYLHQQRMQQMQQMQQMQAQAAAQGSSAQPPNGAGYMSVYDAPTQQNMPARPPVQPKQAKMVQEDPGAQSSSNASSAAAFAESSTAEKKPSQPQSQEHAFATPQMSPTKAYHKYLQGNELSPPTNWPSLYMYPTPGKKSASNSKQSKSNQEKTFGYYPAEVAGPQFTYYDYIVPGLDFRGDIHNRPYPTGTYVNQAFPQLNKPEYPISMGFRPVIPQHLTYQIQQQKAAAEIVIENAAQIGTDGGQGYTMMLNVLDPNIAGAYGARVIASYDGECNVEKPSESLKGLKALELEEDPMKINDSEDDLGNCSFSFVQDQMYKSLLKSIEPIDEKREEDDKNTHLLLTSDLLDGGSSESFSFLDSLNENE